jgi:hypothetical protein
MQSPQSGSADVPDVGASQSGQVNLNIEPGGKVAMQDESGRQYYDDFLSKLLDGAISRKGTFEQRGVSVVTTAGALVTIVFTVVSFVLAHVSGKSINPHAIIRGWIDAATGLFVIASVFGLSVNIPVSYGEPDPLELADLVLPHEERELVASIESGPEVALREEVEPAEPDTLAAKKTEPSGQVNQVMGEPLPRYLTATANTATLEIAQTRVKLLIRARKQNTRKAWLLFAAIVCEVVAILCLAWGIHRLLGL